jgi:uncharacterized protein (TIGR02145 family)
MDLKTINREVKNRVITCLAVFTGIIFALQIACKKVLPEEIPSLVTLNITDITSASFASGGLVFSSGRDPVLSRGICLNTQTNPTISDTKTVDGTGKGSFTSTMSGLTAGTTYYIRAYATNSVGTGYGNQYVINTTGELISIISLTTATISSMTSTSAVSGGNITSDGGSAVTDRGVCWSTTTGPTIVDSKTSDGTGSGSFTSTITALTPGITYFVRAYAINNTGTFYGNEITFNTGCNLPAAPGAITGNSNVFAIASCLAYSISAIPDASGYTWTVPAGAVITSGQGTTSIMVDYGTNGGNVSVRSENSCGNSIYTDLNITMTASSNCGTVTDTDGNVYNSVTIGTQCWLTENLKTTRYNDGSTIPKVSDPPTWSSLITPAYCWYDNDSSTYMPSYGAFYNWYAVSTGKLCPVGWHVPADGDWTELTDFLCGNSMASAKLKESGTVHWNNPNDESTNISGFTALPGGYRSYSDGAFFSVRDNASFWSSTSDDGLNAWMRAMTNYGTTDVRVISAYKEYGISVRCLKDN